MTMAACFLTPIYTSSEKRQLVSSQIKGLLLAAFRSPLMKVLDRSVETLGLWIVTSSITFIKSVNQSSIKPCLIVHLVAVWTLIYFRYGILEVWWMRRWIQQVTIWICMFVVNTSELPRCKERPQSAICCLEWLGRLKCLAPGLDAFLSFLSTSWRCSQNWSPSCLPFSPMYNLLQC